MVQEFIVSIYDALRADRYQAMVEVWMNVWQWLKEGDRGGW